MLFRSPVVDLPPERHPEHHEDDQNRDRPATCSAHNPANASRCARSGPLTKGAASVTSTGPVSISAGSEPILAKARMRARVGHFMPTALLDSQFATLEPPEPGEAVVVDIDQAPEAVLRDILLRLA